MSNIEEVKIIERKFIKDSRGWFIKVINGLEDGLPHHTGEVYLTMGLSGEKKGGHYHPLAKEWFTLIAGEAILRLEDIESNQKKEFHLTLDQPITIFVPHNVAHEFVNIGEDEMIIIAYTDRLYDPEDTISYKL